MVKKFDLRKDVPYIHNMEELELYLKPLYIVDNYLQDEETYGDFMSSMMNLMRGSYTIKRCREYPIQFKFYQKDKKTHTLEFRDFMVNMILWYPFINLSGLHVIDESFIFDCKNDIPNIENYINEKLIIVLRNHLVKSTRINSSISQVLYYLRHISIDFSQILGLNFSAPTFFDMYRNNERIRQIMEVKFDDKLQPHEIEQELHQLEDEEIDIYKKTEGNPIGIILKANTGIKHKQFAEFTISEGLKPSLEGRTIPEPIENSTLLRGLDRPSYLYIDATGSRKSLLEYRY